ncbi:MAG: HypC/HybG/HupF family hydrogenase formation chaperone [Desulfurivibrionaceae bacterium]|nr:HypC/HybG/HupF family hydrogenase formation chaperone [Desulfobulbales bacterium]MDT8334983.1 HypC/HybG/HupF family hydrogenase formation chaperone [Desulfurivibrionaceae bacterium]
MCLAIPGKLVEIYEEAGMKMGRIDYGGTVNRVCLEYVPEIEIGQYTVVHAGFAISIIDEEEAARSFEAWREYTEAAARDGVDVYGNPIDREAE